MKRTPSNIIGVKSIRVFGLKDVFLTVLGERGGVNSSRDGSMMLGFVSKTICS